MRRLYRYIRENGEKKRTEHQRHEKDAQAPPARRMIFIFVYNSPV